MIHRTRQGKAPDGGPEQGRSIVQMGDIFVEYSGAAPTQTELDEHLDQTPEPSEDEVFREALRAKGLVTDAEITAARTTLKQRPRPARGVR